MEGKYHQDGGNLKTSDKHVGTDVPRVIPANKERWSIIAASASKEKLLIKFN